jgi:hypothetical protein
VFVGKQWFYRLFKTIGVGIEPFELTDTAFFDNFNGIYGARSVWLPDLFHPETA